MRRFVFFFIILFLFSFVSQSLLWHYVRFTDEDRWLARVEQLRHDLSSHHYQADNPVYSGHPGMPSTFLSALLYWSGVPLRASLVGGVAILVAFSVASIAVLCRLLRPRSLWWIGASGMVLFHPLYLQASPTNAVSASFAVVIALLVLLVYEHLPVARLWPLLVLGVALGISLSTRLPTTVLFSAPFALWLWRRLGWRRILFVSGVTLTAAIASDPLAWFAPVAHVRYILFRSSLNYTDHVAAVSLEPRDFVLFAPLTLLSMFFAVIFFLRVHKIPSPVPRSFLFTLFVTTGLFCGVFLSVRYQSLRHFHPLLFVWEALFPLFLLHLSEHLRFSSPSPRSQRVFQVFARTSIVILFAGGQLFLLLYSLALPAHKYFADWEAISLYLSHLK